jgi:hypothetical protein
MGGPVTSFYFTALSLSSLKNYFSLFWLCVDHINITSNGNMIGNILNVEENIYDCFEITVELRDL